MHRFAFASSSLLLAVLLAAPGARAQNDPLPPPPPPGSNATSDPFAGLPPPEGLKDPPAPEPAFGRPGQFVVTGASVIGFSSTNYDNSPASHVSVNLSPGIDYFVLRNVSIGATLDAGYADDKTGSTGNVAETQTLSFSVAPRIGWNAPLGQFFSWYPRLAIGFTAAHEQETPANSASSTGNSVGAWFSLYAPFLAHVAPQLFIGFGPTLSHSFLHNDGVANGDPTHFGAVAVVGGYWGSDEAAPNPVAPPAPATARRFGDPGEWVFTAELQGALGTSWSGSGESTTSESVLPGAEYFVVRDVSVGANVYANASQTSNGPSYSANTASFGAAAHLGVNIPLGSAFSLYPRAYVGYGHGSASSALRNTAGQELAGSDSFNESWVALDVPLLVHPAPHFFVGFGPRVNRDLYQQYDYPNAPSASHPATSFGAGLLVGGWL